LNNTGILKAAKSGGVPNLINPSAVAAAHKRRRSKSIRGSALTETGHFWRGWQVGTTSENLGDGDVMQICKRIDVAKKGVKEPFFLAPTCEV